MKDIENLLQPFSFGKKQDLLNLLQQLDKSSVSLETLMKYLEGLKTEQLKAVKEHSEKLKEAQEQWMKVVLRCPECSTPMSLRSVNTRPEDQTGDNSKSIWICTNKDCLETIYNNLTVQEILNQLRGKL